MQEDYTLAPLGDAALVIQFANRIDDAVHARVLQLFQQLQPAPSFIKDFVPAYASLTIHYDVAAVSQTGKPAYAAIKSYLQTILQNNLEAIPVAQRTVRIPVCYADRFAPDLQALAIEKKLTAEELIQLHTATVYRVYMLGFLPGFPYMGKVDSRIATPRKSSPRQSIAAGSVGIAGEQTGIYPLTSPGGWNIIGRTPLPLFTKENENPVLLHPGDRVQFFAITEDAFENYQGRTA